MNLQKAALSSIFLHLCVALILILPSPFAYHIKSEPNRPMIIDFVKIGPRSTAPKLGPQSLPETKATPEIKKERKEEPASSSTKAEAAVLPSTKGEAPPEAAPTGTESPHPTAKPVKKDKPKQAPSTSNKTKSKAPNKLASAKKANQPPSKTKGKPSQGGKAKIDLAQKGKIASSMGDLMGKVQSKEAQGASNAAFAEMFGDELTGTEVDLLNRHMKRFWNMPSGHEKAGDTVVEVELFIRPDGSVEKAKIVDTQRFQKDPQFRIAAESALRAVLDPECSPLPLDPTKYEYWKHMFFVFDPQEMCR